MNNRTHQSYVDCGMKGAIAKWSKEPPFEVRFWKKVSIKDGPEGCWEWNKSPNIQTGYGRVWYKGKRDVGAHRVAYELAFGPIPKGLHVCHKCDNPLCCNPIHLFLGTPKDNAQDKKQKNRSYKPKGELHWNHKLSESDVRSIRSLKKEGLSNSKLAKQFGVSAGTISNVNNWTWGHVI